MFFTEKQNRSNIIGYIKNNISNTIPLRVCLISELRCLFRIFAVRSRSLQCSTVEPPTDYYLKFCTKWGTKLVNDTQQSIVVVVEPLLVAPCTACRISLLPRPFRIERKLALTCLNTQTTLQYKPHKRATKKIVTILTEKNACNNNISINNKQEGWITSCLG